MIQNVHSRVWTLSERSNNQLFFVTTNSAGMNIHEYSPSSKPLLIRGGMLNSCARSIGAIWSDIVLICVFNAFLNMISDRVTSKQMVLTCLNMMQVL